MMQNRTHTCGELRLGDAGKQVKISGWLEKSMSQISALKTGIGVAICFPLLMLLGILLLRKSSRH